MQSELAFGVGCVVPEVVGGKDITEWKKGVSEVLEAIPAIRDLEMSGIETGSRPRKSGETPWGDSYEFTPTRGMLKFRVTIPLRVQGLVASGHTVDGVEDFIVRTYFDYRHPVSFVACEGASPELRNPAAALIVVRQFLRSEIGKLQRPDVRLRTLGPTPFHANFYLVAERNGEEITDDLSVVVEKRPGYDKIRFSYDKEKLALDDATRFTFAWLIPEIATFYVVSMAGTEKGRRATSTMGLAEVLAATYSTRGALSYLRRVVRNRRSLLTLRLALLNAKLMGVHELRGAEEVITAVYSNRTVQVIRPYIDGELSEVYEEELETAEKTLDILDAQHTQEVQRATTFCASLLGVVVGALLTAWLRR
ncbi:hypothetical protein AB0N92_10400 [Streptomyces sp. NPDC093248]|uniref:hypothetical protein n=1 Tax=Streptomyces sp. NPDC093248 TaxID=3155072 RepID=UPI0034449AC9